MVVCYWYFSLVVLLMLNALSWQQWPMTAMQASAIHCSILLLCLGESVSAALRWCTSGGCDFKGPCLPHIQAAILWLQCHQPFFLWYPTSPGFILHRHLPQWASALCLVWLHLDSAFVVIFISYICILLTVLSIKSSGARSKTFSTCASHLIAITLFYGTLLFMYLHPSISYSLDTDKVVAVFYTVVFPMFNPVIYNLRNKDVKNALRKLLDRNWTFKWIGFKVIWEYLRHSLPLQSDNQLYITLYVKYFKHFPAFQQ